MGRRRVGWARLTFSVLLAECEQFFVESADLPRAIYEVNLENPVSLAPFRVRLLWRIECSPAPASLMRRQAEGGRYKSSGGQRIVIPSSPPPHKASILLLGQWSVDGDAGALRCSGGLRQWLSGAEDVGGTEELELEGTGVGFTVGGDFIDFVHGKNV